MTVTGGGFSVAAAESKWCGMVLLLPPLRLLGGNSDSELRAKGADGGGIDRSTSDRRGGCGIGPIVSDLRDTSESRLLRSERSDTDGFGGTSAVEGLPLRFFSVKVNLCGNLTNPSQVSDPQTQTLVAFMK